MNQMGWKRRRVAMDAEGRWWLVKSMRFARGSGIRVHLSRPRMDHFTDLQSAARQYVVIGEMPEATR